MSNEFIIINIAIFLLNVTLFFNAKKVVTFLNHGEENDPLELPLVDDLAPMLEAAQEQGIAPLSQRISAKELVVNKAKALCGSCRKPGKA